MSENTGTPVQAIEFALKIDDHYDMREFLGSWSQGDLSDWPEFLAHINPQPPAPPAWMVEVTREACALCAETGSPMIGSGQVDAYRAGRRDKTFTSKACQQALRLALERGHVVEKLEVATDSFVPEDDPLFNPIWDVIKGWNIGGLAKYGGYGGATGGHVRAIIRAVQGVVAVPTKAPGRDRDGNPPAYAPGVPVQKTSGDYQISGIVRGAILTGAGLWRYAVEHQAEGGGAFLHIYAAANLSSNLPTREA